MSSTVVSLSGNAAGPFFSGEVSGSRKGKEWPAPRSLFGQRAGGCGFRKVRRSEMLVSPFFKEISSTCRAVRSNVSEDTDDMFDDLFKKHGKVVYRSKDQKPTTAEIDDDAESLSFAVEMAKVASDVKAADIKVLFVKPLVYWTRFFIIATAFSNPQINAMKSKMEDLAEKSFERRATGDTKPNSWTLLDFGDVVVHIFLPPERAFYKLEEFYANATPIDLSFLDQPPPLRP